MGVRGGRGAAGGLEGSYGQGDLVGRRQLDPLGGSATLQVDHRAVAGRRGEGAVQGDPPVAAPQFVGRPVGVVHAEGQLGADAVLVAQQGGARGLHRAARTRVQARGDSVQPVAKEVHGSPDRVDADVEQRAAAEFGHVPDVAGGQTGHGERGAEGAQFADRPLVDQGAHGLVLGVMDEHDVLHQRQRTLPGQRQQRACPRGLTGQRLLGEDVLAGQQRRFHPGGAQRGGQRYVHRVHVVPAEQVRIAGDGTAAVPPRDVGGPCRVAAGDRGDLDAVGGREGGQHPPSGDVCAPQHPYAQRMSGGSAYGLSHGRPAPPPPGRPPGYGPGR